MEDANRRADFLRSVGFVMLHYNNRRVEYRGQPELSEKIESFDEVVEHCIRHNLPLVYSSGSYFREKGSSGRSTGLHKGPTWLGNGKLLVSYHQFLEKYSYKLIELWRSDCWSTQAAARLIEEFARGKQFNPLSRLAGCDLLVQGYLTITNSELRSTPRADLPSAHHIVESARDAILPALLARPIEANTSEEIFWFDDCRKDIEDAFSVETDNELENIMERTWQSFDESRWLVRSIHSNHSRDAAQAWWHLPLEEREDKPGALRLLVEIIKGSDSTFLEAAGWPQGFTTSHGNNNAIADLMLYAHDEFLRAWHDLNILLRSDRYSFESTRNELHHDKLKNEFLFAVAYDADEVGNETRNQIMRDAIKGDESSLRLLKRGSELWRSLGPTLVDFFNSVSRRYGFVVSDRYEQSKDEVKRAITTIDAIMERVKTGKFIEHDIDSFWDAADRIRGLLSDLAISRRFGDYVIDIDSRLIKENKSA